VIPSKEAVMNDQFPPLITDGAEFQAAPDDDYEEITSDEVDRIVAALEELMESTESLNIRACLEDAATNVYSLVYDDEDLDDLSEAA
jgi:hypothetical protein